MSWRTVVEGHRHSPPREKENKICEGLRSSCFGTSMARTRKAKRLVDGILHHESPPSPHVSMGEGEEESRLEPVHAERSIVFPAFQMYFQRDTQF